MPSDDVANAPDVVPSIKPWTQPLFMVFDYGSDQKVPLTQERLDQLLRLQQMYAMMMSDIRRYHDDYVRSNGATPRPWEEPPK